MTRLVGALFIFLSLFFFFSPFGVLRFRSCGSRRARYVFSPAFHDTLFLSFVQGILTSVCLLGFSRLLCLCGLWEAHCIGKLYCMHYQASSLKQVDLYYYLSSYTGFDPIVLVS
jgi:hypothetical protein